MTREEFIKKEIEKQTEKEKSKVFKKFRVVVYEQKKSGGYPFADFETDNKEFSCYQESFLARFRQLPE